MIQEALFGIGKLIGTFGVQGQLVLQHSLGKKTALTGLEVLLVEVKRNDLLPFFVSETKIKNETEVYIRLEDINSREKAQKLVSRPVWLKETDFKKYVSKSATISLLGYTVYNREQALSEIIEVIEQPHQVLAKIRYLGKEMLIPVHESFILNTDTKNKKLVLDLPEGLLDIY